MNFLDISVLFIFACCIWLGYHRGLVLSLYSVCGWLLALVLARQAYPYVNQFLLNSFVYDLVYQLVEANLGLEEMIAERSQEAQNALISALGLPLVIVGLLQAGNNPVLYEAFKATNIAEYIHAYLTVLCINVLSLVLSFIIISLIMRVILQSLNIVTRLPVIKTLNRAGGAVAGAIQGLLVVWIFGLIITALIAMGSAPLLGEMLGSSTLAQRFVENNYLLDIVFRVVNVNM
ncbi:MAG: CvpA family protein [Defluviitaleaceae bacterium]|nr:CvpA family protein [Defluviitaleaceae bacterium]